jgi:hypothetical protein
VIRITGQCLAWKLRRDARDSVPAPEHEQCGFRNATLLPPVVFSVMRAFAQQHPENVSFQFLSLRQSLREQLSPLDFDRVEIVNNHGLSQEKLRTSLDALEGRNSFSAAIFLQASGLCGCSMDLVSD